MDIAKYVGLFLIKSEYCFLPGIGGLQVVRRAAAYNPETQQMNPTSYELVFDQRIGAIDDAFANFIANNERISIVHAANYLKDYCAAAKNALREGREVEIPGIGKFIPGANEAIQFVQDPHLHIAGRQIPYFKNSPTVEQKREEPITNIIERTTIKEPKADEKIEYKPPTVNWGKIIVVSIIALAVIAGIIYLFIYFNKSEGEELPTPEVSTMSTETEADSAPQPIEPSSSNNSITSHTSGYSIAIGTYNTRARAENRVNQLRSYGNEEVSMLSKDSNTFYVVFPVAGSVTDSAAVIDSLSNLYNPGGRVFVVQ